MEFGRTARDTMARQTMELIERTGRSLLSLLSYGRAKGRNVGFVRNVVFSSDVFVTVLIYYPTKKDLANDCRKLQKKQMSN